MIFLSLSFICVLSLTGYKFAVDVKYVEFIYFFEKKERIYMHIE